MSKRNRNRNRIRKILCEELQTLAKSLKDIIGIKYVPEDLTLILFHKFLAESIKVDRYGCFCADDFFLTIKTMQQYRTILKTLAWYAKHKLVEMWSIDDNILIYVNIPKLMERLDDDKKQQFHLWQEELLKFVKISSVNYYSHMIDKTLLEIKRLKEQEGQHE